MILNFFYHLTPRDVNFVSDVLSSDLVSIHKFAVPHCLTLNALNFVAILLNNFVDSVECTLKLPIINVPLFEKIVKIYFYSFIQQ